MRLGSIVIGFLLAILVAYVHDASVASLSVDGHPQNLVNWEVFGRTVSAAGEWLRQQMDGLLDRLRGS